MEVRIEEREPIRLAGIEHVGPFEKLPPVFERLCATAGRLNLFGPDTRVFTVVYTDPEKTPEEELRSFAAISVPEDFEAKEGLEIRVLAAGPTAVGTHVGSYDGLAASWKAFVEKVFVEMGKRGAEGRPCYEIYVDDPSTLPPEKVRTELCAPLAG